MYVYHKGVGVAHEIISPIQFSPDDDGAVLVSRQDPKCFQKLL